MRCGRTAERVKEGVLRAQLEPGSRICEIGCSSREVQTVHRLRCTRRDVCSLLGDRSDRVVDPRLESLAPKIVHDTPETQPEVGLEGIHAGLAPRIKGQVVVLDVFPDDGICRNPVVEHLAAILRVDARVVALGQVRTS